MKTFRQKSQLLEQKLSFIFSLPKIGVTFSDKTTNFHRDWQKKNIEVNLARLPPRYHPYKGLPNKNIPVLQTKPRREMLSKWKVAAVWRVCRRLCYIYIYLYCTPSADVVSYQYTSINIPPLALNVFREIVILNIASVWYNHLWK